MTGMGVVQQILISIVAGLIVVLIVEIIIEIKIINKIINEIINKPPKYSKLKIFLILLAVLAFIALLLPENSQIQITDPEEGDYVSWRYTVKGTSNIEPNCDLNIYVFIFADKWYAQPKAIISSNGDWETRCKFGNREYVGLNYTYDICAIVTSKDFKLEEQFKELPDYKNTSSIIKVTRK